MNPLGFFFLSDGEVAFLLIFLGLTIASLGVIFRAIARACTAENAKKAVFFAAKVAAKTAAKDVWKDYKEHHKS